MTKAVMGLDLSVSSTGICVIDPQEGVHLWRVNGGGCKGIARIARIVDQITQVRDWAAGLSPNLLTVIEGYGVRGGENAVLIELGGVVRYSMYRAGLPYVVVPPSSLKKFVTGKGNADKVMVCEYLVRRFNRSFLREWAGKNHPKAPKLEPSNWGTSPSHWDHDSADAFALSNLGYALTYDQLPGLRQLTNYEKEVLEGIRLDPKGELLEDNSLRKDKVDT